MPLERLVYHRVRTGSLTKTTNALKHLIIVAGKAKGYLANNMQMEAFLCIMNDHVGLKTEISFLSTCNKPFCVRLIINLEELPFQ